MVCVWESIPHKEISQNDWGPDKTWSPVSEENAPLQRQTMIATLAHELKTT